MAGFMSECCGSVAKVSPYQRSVLELCDVSIRLKRKQVLYRCSVNIGAGEILEVGGSNGSGKTTLLRVIAGVVQPSSGSRIGPPTCAYVPAAIPPPNLRVCDWIDHMPAKRLLDPREVLERLAFAGDLSASCRALSFGNLRKLMLADAFSSDQVLIVIDEASAGLDNAGHKGLAELVLFASRNGVGIVLADQVRALPLRNARHVKIRDGAIESSSGGTSQITVEGPEAAVPQLIHEAAKLGFHRSSR